MRDPDPIALFRLSLLGPLVSRTQLTRGELKATLRELASKEYDIPGSRRRQVAEKTLQSCGTTAIKEGPDGTGAPAALGSGSIQDRRRGSGATARGQAREPAPLDPHAAAVVGSRRRRTTR